MEEAAIAPDAADLFALDGLQQDRLEVEGSSLISSRKRVPPAARSNAPA